MKPMMPARSRALFSLLFVSSLAACNQQANTTKAPAATASSCPDYAARVCKEAGEETPACDAVKSATELMAPEACATGLAKIDFTVKKVAEKRKSCETLENKLCDELGRDTETCAMVSRETKKFPPERCDLMMQHYDEVLADLKKQEERNKPLPAEKQEQLTQGNPPAFGPADAKVTIVEFSDFQCPFCSRAATVAHKIKEKHGDKVRFVFRQFPLSFHPNAHEAAQASLAAHEQGKFWEYHDKLFANQQKLDRASLEQYAKEVGLDLAKFKKALDSKTYASIVDAELKLGEEVAVDGTPTMFLNGARVPNPTDFEAVEKQIEKALSGS